MKTSLPRIYKITGIAYVLAWIVGLSSGGPNITLDASGSTIATAYAAHKTGAVMQFLFSEGIAGLMLLLLVVSVVCGLRKRGLSGSAKLFGISGVMASLISLVMSVLGLVLVVSAVPHGSTEHVKELSNLVNRLDGPKMWLLGLMAIGGVSAFALPKWHKVTGYAMAIAIAVSGVAYGFLIQPLAWSAYVSGTLLLVWVCGLGVILGSRKSAS